MSEFGAAMARLSSAQKPSQGAAAYSRFVNRPLGRPLAAAAFVLGLTPTQVTLASGAATAAGIVGVATMAPSWWSSLLVTALLVLGYALDSADGQLARLTETRSLAGEWLDHFFDAIKAATIHLAVFICWVRFYDLDSPWLAAPLVFGVSASVFFFGIIVTDLLRRLHGRQHNASASRLDSLRAGWLYSLIVLPTDYGLLCLSFIFLWWQQGFTIWYVALTVINALVLVMAASRWYLSLRRLEANRA